MAVSYLHSFWSIVWEEERGRERGEGEEEGGRRREGRKGEWEREREERGDGGQEFPEFVVFWVQCTCKFSLPNFIKVHPEADHDFHKWIESLSYRLQTKMKRKNDEEWKWQI
jgi:hypothetical protein